MSLGVEEALYSDGDEVKLAMLDTDGMLETSCTAIIDVECPPSQSSSEAPSEETNTFPFGYVEPMWYDILVADPKHCQPKAVHEAKS